MAPISEIRFARPEQSEEAQRQPEFVNKTAKLVNESDVNTAIHFLKLGHDIVVPFYNKGFSFSMTEVDFFQTMVRAGVGFEVKCVWNEKKKELTIVRISVNDAS